MVPRTQRAGGGFKYLATSTYLLQSMSFQLWVNEFKINILVTNQEFGGMNPHIILLKLNNMPI